MAADISRWSDRMWVGLSFLYRNCLAIIRVQRLMATVSRSERNLSSAGRRVRGAPWFISILVTKFVAVRNVMNASCRRGSMALPLVVTRLVRTFLILTTTFVTVFIVTY